MPEPEPQSFACPDCGAQPAELHREDCDQAHCPDTGQQRLMCDHDGQCDSRWSGDYPGAAECRAWGWWLNDHPDLGLVPCPAGTPGAIEDFNRLLTHARWDAANQRYIRNGDEPP
jgi:hypothetical protein